jgi:hypothetical protein
MYFEFDKKNDMASYFSLSYQAMENVLQKLDAVVKNESTSLPFAISLQKLGSPTIKSMINQQVSLTSQVLKNPKANNAQRVSEIVELMILTLKKQKFPKKQPLKHLKKTLLSLETYEEENKQGIETHKEDWQTNPKKNRGQPLGSKNNKKNSTANNVIHKRNVLTKKGETPWTSRAFCV